ncbi:MAG: stage II sporulation protein D [Clostridia bacterium]|nr:stage II sporulation protein D [Clostridia bacterium]
MKKVMFYILFVIFLIIVLPIVFTKRFETEEVSKINPYDYGDYSKISLLHVQTGAIEELTLDEYLYGVVASEMPASFEVEALKAQSVVARTYTIYQMKNSDKHKEADLCDSSLCCQAWMTKENRFSRWEDDKENEYWNKIVKAVNDTKGKIIFYNDEPINALFHSNSGGITELAINVWGGDYPYLQIVETAGEDAYTSFKSEVKISKDQLVEIMNSKYTDFSIDFYKDDYIKINSYTNSKRVSKIKIGNKELTGVEARNLLGLKSTQFDFKIEGDDIFFSVIGYGHGVGFSQCGGDVLAKLGKSYEEIIKYYYKDVSIHE